MSNPTYEIIRFSPERVAPALLVAPSMAGRKLVKTLSLPRPLAVFVLNGGTAELAPELAQRLRIMLEDGLALVAAEHQIMVVTGGADAGIFALFGQGRGRWPESAPCIGVAVEQLVSRPGHPDGEATLEPHHSHFVLVEGANWGDETATMYEIVAALARDCPSIAVFVGGGEIVKQEMLANVRHRRKMVLLAGSGRTTDAVLAARAGAPTDDAAVRAVADSGLVIGFDIDQDPAALRELIRGLLSLGEPLALSEL
jgi:hypothetical protein